MLWALDVWGSEKSLVVIHSIQFALRVGLRFGLSRSYVWSQVCSSFAVQSDRSRALEGQNYQLIRIVDDHLVTLITI